MATLQSQVLKYQEKNTHLNCKQVQNHFCEKSPGYIKKLFYQNKKATKIVTQKVTEVTLGSKITMENMEALLVKQLKKRADTQTLRLMVDFLKIKQQDQSELKEIDLEIFYKKAMED